MPRLICTNASRKRKKEDRESLGKAMNRVTVWIMMCKLDTGVRYGGSRSVGLENDGRLGLHFL